MVLANWQLEKSPSRPCGKITGELKTQRQERRVRGREEGRGELLSSRDQKGVSYWSLVQHGPDLVLTEGERKRGHCLLGEKLRLQQVLDGAANERVIALPIWRGKGPRRGKLGRRKVKVWDERYLYRDETKYNNLRPSPREEARFRRNREMGPSTNQGKRDTSGEGKKQFFARPWEKALLHESIVRKNENRQKGGFSDIKKP